MPIHIVVQPITAISRIHFAFALVIFVYYLEMTQMYFKKDRYNLSEFLYKSPVLILYRYFNKRMIEKKQITITYCYVVCKSGVWKDRIG